jgi:hypothetical protein
MTRPWLVAILLASCLPAQAPAQSGAPDAAQRVFLEHRPGQPTLSGGAFQTAREVQEGCDLPCASPAETAVYLKKIETAAGQLGISSPADLAKARENYAPKGVPRKKTAAAAAAPISNGPRLLPPNLGTRLAAWAQDNIVTPLGLSSLLPAQIVAEPVAQSPTSTKPAAAPAPRVSNRGVPGPMMGLDPSQVEQKFTEALDAEISRYPTGKKSLDSLPEPPLVELMKSGSPSLNAWLVKGSPDKIVFNTARFAEAIDLLDPAGAKGLDLSDPAVLRQHLARHPEEIDALAKKFDVLYVHELTHAIQHRREGAGWLDDQVSAAIDRLNGHKYPVEKEWEAFGVQNQYLIEKARTDPTVLSLSGPESEAARDFIGYVDNLSQYRREKASLSYEGKTDTLDHLTLHSAVEKAVYAAALAKEDKQWPRRSVEGFLLLARSQNLQSDPVMALPYLKTAYDRAAANGFLDSVRGEVAEVFKESLAGIESRLAPEKKPWSLGQQSRTLIRQLNADLKLPLPPRVAAALGRQ